MAGVRAVPRLWPAMTLRVLLPSLWCRWPQKEGEPPQEQESQPQQAVVALGRAPKRAPRRLAVSAGCGAARERGACVL